MEKMRPTLGLIEQIANQLKEDGKYENELNGEDLRYILSNLAHAAIIKKAHANLPYSVIVDIADIVEQVLEVSGRIHIPKPEGAIHFAYNLQNRVNGFEDDGIELQPDSLHTNIQGGLVARVLLAPFNVHSMIGHELKNPQRLAKEVLPSQLLKFGYSGKVDSVSFHINDSALETTIKTASLL